MARVSVCVPVYTSVDTVGRSIESALSQTYPDFECLMVDDDSTDRTAEVAKRFADRRIRLVRNSKKPFKRARERARTRVRGLPPDIPQKVGAR